MGQPNNKLLVLNSNTLTESANILGLGRNQTASGYHAVIDNATGYFRDKGIDVTSPQGYEKVARSAALLESYIDQLTEGVSADHLPAMQQLMRNSNSSILTESSMTAISGISALTLPCIRRQMPLSALKEAVKTIVPTTPRQAIVHTKPYMFKGDDHENKVYLPAGLKSQTDGTFMTDIMKKTVFAGSFDFSYEESCAFNVPDVYDSTDETITWASGTPAEFLATVEGSATKRQPLDFDFKILAITYTNSDGESVVNKINKKPGINGDISVDVTHTIDGTTHTIGKLLVSVNFKGHSIALSFVPAGASIVDDSVDVSVSFEMPISSEFNEDAWSVGFEVDRMDVDIPSGQHINAPLTVEAIKDLNALYSMDATKEIVELMTDVFAIKLDCEILEFLKTSFEGQPTVDFPGYNYGNNEATDYARIFDCKPDPGYHGGAKEWREQIKIVIDHLAISIKNNTYLRKGMFTIIANPLDAVLISNIDWQYKGGQGGSMDGVDVDYAVGTYIGANTYRVLSTPLAPEGGMYIIFVPNTDKQLTYTYFPYSFTTESGYIDPNRSRVPSIMMTKRHAFLEFMPAIGYIEIENNDPSEYRREYVIVGNTAFDGTTSYWQSTASDSGSADADADVTV